MGRSFSRLTPDTAIEDFTSRNHYHHAASDTYYDMLRRDGMYFQRRYQLGPDHQPTNIDEKQIDFVIGSGNHARTYLHLTARGTLMQLPVGWYSESGGFWAMSPGYDSPIHPDNHRVIGYDCMFCHNAYPQTPGTNDRFATVPRFTGAIPQGIDCERCHGPGQEHVEIAKHAGAKLEQIRQAILNPARLAPERQLEVCMQCHLEPNSFHPTQDFKRYGRSWFDYDPRESLSNFMLFFDSADTRSKSNRFQIAGAAYRLRQSACFVKSAGKLQCTICHNPHDVGHGADSQITSNNICARCHRPGELKHHTADSNCVSCHMPKRRTEDVVNVVMTDHYIQRHKPAGDLLASLAERHETDNTTTTVVPYYPSKLGKTADDPIALAIVRLREDPRPAPALLAEAAGLLRAEAPTYADPFFELAGAYRRSGNVIEAISWYRHAITRDPRYLEALLALAGALNDAGQQSEAMQVLQNAALLAPGDSRIWTELGRSKANGTELSDAAAALNKAITLDPDAAAPHNTAGILLARTGNAREAEMQFREAVRIDPNLGEARHNLARLLAIKGKLDEAAWQLENAVRVQPNDVATRITYATVLYTQGANDAALQQANAAVLINPDSPEAHHVRGNVLERKKNVKEATREYGETVRLDPTNARAQLDLGAVLAASGQKEQALTHLKQAAQSDQPDIRRLAQQLMIKLPVE